jgi:hypothetical protein
MLVIVTMKDGALYKGVKCGSEGGLLYLANPLHLTKDEEDMEGYMESPVGDEVHGLRLLLVPVADIKNIVSNRN